MALMIDPPNAPGHGRLWSHLASDTSFEELHELAAELGIPRRGFDGDHYDVPAERYDAVVALGVEQVSSRELVRRLHAAGLRRRKGGGSGARPVLRRPGDVLAAPRRSLRAGDVVAVVAPSGPVPRPRLDAGVEVLRSWGLEVSVAPAAVAVDQRPAFLAAPDEQRAAELTRAWCDPEVAAVVCARGGYGAHRVLDLLDWERLARASAQHGPKPLVGFSDVTALHQAFAARLGVATVHGPVVTSLGAGDDASRERLRALLMGPTAPLPLTASAGGAVVGGRARGTLVGGNVAVLAAGVGGSGWWPARRSVVLLEDVAEEPYRLDRLLTQLRRSGWLAGCAGVALGSFTDCGPADDVAAVLADRLGDLGVPVLAGLPVGHGPANHAVWLGRPAVLDADAGTLTPG